MWPKLIEIHSRDQAGYTYISALILLVAATLTAQTTWIPDRTVKQREIEAELIFRGSQIRDAIAAYHAADPEAPVWPADLEALLDDPRDGTRHLRRLYDLPGEGDGWSLIAAEEGGIRGVSPKRDGVPLKQANFPPDLSHFEGADSYRDWVFSVTLNDDVDVK